MTIRKVIAGPGFHLTSCPASSGWPTRRSRSCLRIGNLAAMQAKGAGQLHYEWSVARSLVEFKDLAARQAGPPPRPKQRETADCELP